MANPEILAIRNLLAQSPKNLSAVELRVAYDGLGAMFPTLADIKFSSDKIGAIAAEWSATPKANQDQVILYLHGGGFVIGSLASHRHLAAELGRASGTRTLAIDYRLAPESPFPAAVDDALSGYKFLLDRGIKPASIAIAGDSAGGGLAVATLAAARDAGLPQPSCALCISPWVDLEMIGESMTSKAQEDPMVQREMLQQWTNAYLGKAPARTPLAAPIHANLKGIAPLLIQVGSAETLLDDSIRLAARAGAQEVSVRLETWPEMIHVWHFFHPMLADARRALAVAGNFIRESMNQ